MFLCNISLWSAKGPYSNHNLQGDLVQGHRNQKGLILNITDCSHPSSSNSEPSRSQDLRAVTVWRQPKRRTITQRRAFRNEMMAGMLEQDYYHVIKTPKFFLNLFKTTCEVTFTTENTSVHLRKDSSLRSSRTYWKEKHIPVDPLLQNLNFFSHVANSVHGHAKEFWQWLFLLILMIFSSKGHSTAFGISPDVYPCVLTPCNNVLCMFTAPCVISQYQQTPYFKGSRSAAQIDSAQTKLAPGWSLWATGNRDSLGENMQ